MNCVLDSTSVSVCLFVCRVVSFISVCIKMKFCPATHFMSPNLNQIFINIITQSEHSVTAIPFLHYIVHLAFASITFHSVELLGNTDNSRLYRSISIQMIFTAHASSSSSFSFIITIQFIPTQCLPQGQSNL